VTPTRGGDRDATPGDRPAIWPFFRAIVAAGETYPYDTDMPEAQARGLRMRYRAMVFNAVVEVNGPAVALWGSLGFEILATIPEAFAHPTQGCVGLHVMHRRL